MPWGGAETREGKTKRRWGLPVTSLPTPDHHPRIYTSSGSIPLVVAAWWGAEGKVSIFVLVSAEKYKVVPGNCLVFLLLLRLALLPSYYSLGTKLNGANSLRLVNSVTQPNDGNLQLLTPGKILDLHINLIS